MDLDDVGTVTQVVIPRLGRCKISVRVLMGIKTPTGQMFLFSPLPDNYVQRNSQAEAIRTFMREHRDDRICHRL